VTKDMREKDGNGLKETLKKMAITIVCVRNACVEIAVALLA